MFSLFTKLTEKSNSFLYYFDNDNGIEKYPIVAEDDIKVFFLKRGRIEDFIEERMNQGIYFDSREKLIEFESNIQKEHIKNALESLKKLK